ncbi:WD40 repeat-like protein [Tilletiaria anomala UBC 951]|uniref:WD40 repeat-like protein n=1 Tax=Tilletiaria anomala (strain ATCC 24038 / CBS 436.72 / UBC 951) TaxID=1037660 RepID=A0A066VH95_TILAU|nr:WD40 repeat-like protein [Tilletiaria anomala UBC 951]KDN37935.1 WD40 repeat-like protein [Tilletiaria anomala UBC 951]
MMRRISTTTTETLMRLISTRRSSIPPLADFTLEDEEDFDEDDDDDVGVYSYVYDTRMLHGHPEGFYDRVERPIAAGLQAKLSGDFGRLPRWHTSLSTLLPSTSASTRDTSPLTSGYNSKRRRSRRTSRRTSSSASSSDDGAIFTSSRRGQRSAFLVPHEESEEDGRASQHTAGISAFSQSRNLADMIYARKTARASGSGARAGETEANALARSQLGAYVPNSDGVEVARYGSACYCGQYSQDSSFFYTCTQDYRVQMYDVNIAPLHRAETHEFGFSGGFRHRLRQMYHEDESSHTTSLQLRRSIAGRMCNWTISDAHLSPDNRWMIYSSLTPHVHLVPTADVAEGVMGSEPGAPVALSNHGARMNTADSQQVMLDFTGQSSSNGYYGDALFSIRFSGNGKEIVAGARAGDIYVYDIEARGRVLSIEAHSDDVNSVCFADAGSTNMLLSGSDDGTVKVWDRRSLSNAKAAGTLQGHSGGLTFVAPKGDGRYCVSNGKDHACKLWDLRMMSDGDAAASPISGKMSHFRERKDHSLMTYRGHAVCRTLIRCNFSPIATTGQQYVYSGSADGRIHIWSLDGRTVQTLDRSRSMPLISPVPGRSRQPNDPSAPESDPPVPSRDRRVINTVRDVSWHSSEPSLMSTSWGSAGGDGGSVAKHEWKGFGKNGLTKLEDWVEKMRAECYA